MVCGKASKCVCDDSWIDENEDDSDGCEMFSNSYQKDDNQCDDNGENVKLLKEFQPKILSYKKLHVLI